VGGGKESFVLSKEEREHIIEEGVEAERGRIIGHLRWDYQNQLGMTE